MNDRVTPPPPRPADPPAFDAPPRDRRRMYAAVLALEALVIAALWAFSRYFGAS